MNEALRDVFDRVAENYREVTSDKTLIELAEDFYKRLEDKRGHCLSLGCGAGDHFSQYFLEKNWRVLGVDFSERMLALANERLPKMKTMRADISELYFNLHRFDAAMMISSLHHLPRADHAQILKNIYSWLNPGGYLFFNYATEHQTGQEEFEGDIAFNGEHLFFSHKTPGELFLDLKRAGFVFVGAEYRAIDGSDILWITAQKPEE